MRAIDTNVLVRLVIRDDTRQVAAAEAFVAHGAWVSIVVLVEAIWVWSSIYNTGREQIARSLEILLDNPQLAFQEQDVVVAALRRFQDRRALSFSDCIILEAARKEGYLPLGTFDRDLAKADGAQKL